ncbi:MAG: hypothetical protein WBE35_01040, partial [Candidatus Cybelea sp.]
FVPAPPLSRAQGRAIYHPGNGSSPRATDLSGARREHFGTVACSNPRRPNYKRYIWCDFAPRLSGIASSESYDALPTVSRLANPSVGRRR